MTGSASAKLSATINVKCVATNFALTILLSEIVDVRAEEQFDVFGRAFYPNPMQSDIYIVDYGVLRESEFFTALTRQCAFYEPRIVAILPNFVSAIYGQRLMRLGVSVCPMKFGLASVVRTVQAINSALDSDQQQQTIIDPRAETYLNYGASSQSSIESIPEKFWFLLPRLELDEVNLRSELNTDFDTLDKLVESFLEYMLQESSSVADSKRRLRALGIAQFPSDFEIGETSLLFDQALSVIAKWRSDCLQTSVGE
ncbi:MAG TPA: hypothetical protein V6C76_08370 [Drouetiella sp.]